MLKMRSQLLFFFFVVFTYPYRSFAAENWPCWRGPQGDGTSHETNLPTRWNSEEHVRWKVELLGEGHASPIVWENRIFIASCIPETKARVLIALNRNSGQKVWQKTVIESPLETKHGLNSYASSTPATDGELVYVTFLKSSDRMVTATNVSKPREVSLGEMVVAAYDFEGNQRWMVQPGEFVSVHGFCSCPVIFEDLLIINGDHDGESYIVALEKKTGRQVWKIPRSNKTRSYVTPIVREFGGKKQMILSGDKSVTSYDPRSGAPIWNMDGPTEQFVASLVDDGSRVFLTAGYPDKHILAIDPTGTGNVTESHIVWRSKRNCAYVPSPIVVGNFFLLTSDEGVASCYDTVTGEQLWVTRLEGHYSTSPVTAAGLVYFTSDAGVTKVVRPGPKFELVATNALQEECFASAAVSQGSLFFRTSKHLICIE